MLRRRKVVCHGAGLVGRRDDAGLPDHRGGKSGIGSGAIEADGLILAGGSASGGITVEGGARGVRALFTSKPSEKQVEHVKRVGALAVRTLVAVLSADGELDPDEEDLRAALVASLGLPDEDEQKLLKAGQMTAGQARYQLVDAKTKLKCKTTITVTIDDDGIVKTSIQVTCDKVPA